jgi:hypothetical protein
MFIYILYNNQNTTNLRYNILVKHLALKPAVEPGHSLSEYARNIVAQGEIEHQTAGLFEPEG